MKHVHTEAFRLKNIVVIGLYTDGQSLSFFKRGTSMALAITK